MKSLKEHLRLNYKSFYRIITKSFILRKISIKSLNYQVKASFLLHILVNQQAWDDRYCNVHQKQADRYYEKHQRNPAVKKLYGRMWKRIRDRYIAAPPLCEQCCKDNKLTASMEVHHIKPLSQGGYSRRG